MDPELNIPLREKVAAVYRVAEFRPLYTIGVVVLSALAAILEGFGLSFILPIVELAQQGTNPQNADGLLGFFVDIYGFFGVPFTLGALVVGVSAVMVVRFTASFLVAWLRAAIEAQYIRHLQVESFDHALDAKIAYFDREGSDKILNAIVTQAEYAGRSIRRMIMFLEQGLLSLMYLLIAFYLAPLLTVVTAIFLGTLTVVFRNVVEGGYSIGDRVADANEQIQEAAQAGTQGIREIKLFGIASEVFSKLDTGTAQYVRSYTKLQRNQQAIRKFYALMTAISVFVLIYAAITYASISLGGLGVFLFAMFRLGPRVSAMNQRVYQIEGDLPHLVRTQQFIDDLEADTEPETRGVDVPETIRETAFEDVEFAYEGGDEEVLKGVSFAIEKNEFVAFVGPSGAGKSTIADLLARLYTPTDGRITANGTPITEFGIREWREQVSLVRQDPHIFNDTLRRNVSVANREASNREVERVCEIAQVTEFLDDLPAGYETELGDDGVRLSGGQRQRVSIARALLKDAEILVFDEATSDLDTSLEQRVHEGIESMERDYAMVVIAHRLSTVTNADQIYTVKTGEIVERGTHEELIEQSGAYANLYSLQAS